MSHHLVKIENVHYQYPDGNIALADISCNIHHGEAVAIIGANGSGKSTLLRHINGILFANAGAIFIGDTPVIKDTLTNIRKTVGMVFQNSDEQLFMPTVYDDMAFGLINLGYPQAQVQEIVEKTLAQFNCGHLANRPPFTLSGGEKRKVTIAIVMALSPDILLMDEPTSNLDSRSRREFYQIVANFTHTRIIATHDLDLANDLCSRVIILDKGAIVADDKTQEIFSDRRLLEQFGLELPMKMQNV